MKKLFIPLLATGLLSGCQTYQAQSHTAQARQTQDQLIQQENQRRMAGRIETLEIEIGRISHELDNLRKTMDARYTNLERKTEDDKREMIARLTSQLEKLLAQATPPVQTQPTPSENAYGYEHIVQKGETLSTIAKAYNVTTKAIISANKIKDPDRVSVGQKLFIPE